MENLFGGGAIIKIIAFINLIGTALLAMEAPYNHVGQMVIGLGSVLGFMIVRQANVSSEQAGAGITPPSSRR